MEIPPSPFPAKKMREEGKEHNNSSTNQENHNEVTILRSLNNSNNNNTNDNEQLVPKHVELTVFEDTTSVHLEQEQFSA